MNSSPSVRALSLLLPVGVLVTAVAVGARGRRDRSVLPPSPEGAASGQPAPGASEVPAAPGAVATGVEISVLRAGPEPYVWATPGRIASSFISDSASTLAIVAMARAPEGEITWEIDPPAGFSVPADAVLKGPQLRVRLQRPDGNPTGGGGPLTLAVTARLEGRAAQATVTLRQDLRDRLRQEYVDLGRAGVPARDDLLDEARFIRRYRKKCPDVRFAELNWSRQPGTEDRYPAILVNDRLVRLLQALHGVYGRTFTVSSGFRNPVRQQEVHGSVGESHHQYGRAADLFVAPDSAPPKTGRKIASEADWLRLAAASMRAGGVWVEPMLDCHVNTDGCHVHVDVRESGPACQVVHVTGQVTDAWGNPLPGATVRLAGMPGTTNARGEYSLKHVLVPRDYELAVEAPGGGALTQTVTLRGAETRVALRMPVAPQPTLVARTADSSRDAAGNLTARVAVRNVGGTPARAVRLSSLTTGSAGKVGQVIPAEVAALGPGQETLFHIQLALGPAAASRGGTPLDVPLRLNASFQTAEGASRAQNLPLTVAAPPVPAPREQVGPPAGSMTRREETVPPAKREGEIGPAAAGMAAGGAAAAIGALARRRSRPGTPVPAPAEPSVDPGKSPPADPAPDSP